MKSKETWEVLLLFVLIFIFLILFLASFKTILRVPDLEEPQAGNYFVDTDIYLRTFYLMEKGDNFYLALKSSREEDGRGNLLSNDILTWRPPTSFYLWNMFAANGYQILILFILFCLVFIFCGYKLMIKLVDQKYILLGLVPLCIYLYQFIYGSVRFLFIEWWGLFFFMVGLTSLIYDHKKLAFLFLTLAVATRELFIIPIVFYFIYSLFKKNERLFFLAILGVSFILFLIHGSIIKSLTEETRFNLVFYSRFHQFSFEDLRSMILFSTDSFYSPKISVPIIIFWLTLTVLVANLFIKLNKNYHYFFLSILSFLLLLPLFSTRDNNYWAIFFVPLMLVSLALMGNVINLVKNYFS